MTAPSCLRLVGKRSLRATYLAAAAFASGALAALAAPAAAQQAGAPAAPAAPAAIAEAIAALASGDTQEVLEPAFASLRSHRALAERHLAAPAPVGPRCAVAISDGPPVPIAALRAAAEDRNAYVRGGAARAMAAIEGRTATQALVQLSVDPAGSVRWIAWQSLAARFAAHPQRHGDLLALLRSRLERRIGGYDRATFDELGQRAQLVEQLHGAGAAARPLFASVLELPRPEAFWLAVEVNKVRSQALAGLLAIGSEAQPVLPALTRHLRSDAWDLQLRRQGLAILRKLRVPRATEAALCARAYSYALAAKPIDGLQEGYQRYFRDQQNQLLDAAVRGLLQTGDVDMLAELERGARSLAPTVMLAARVRSAAWTAKLVAQVGKALPQLGADATAQEATLLAALTERLRSGDPPRNLDAGDADAGNLDAGTHALLHQLLATCERFAGMRRAPGRPYHYLHAPSIQALRRIGPTLTEAPRAQLIDRLVQAGNFPAADSAALAALCVDIDPELARQRRDRGQLGRRLHSRLAQVAPHLLVADLASKNETERRRAQQSLKSYGRSSGALHEQFRRLLKMERLPDADASLRILARNQPPTTLEPDLAPWLSRSDAAYVVLGAMRPVRVDAMRKQLRSVCTSTPAGDPTRRAAVRLRQLLAGIKMLGSDGSPYVPILRELADETEWTASYITEVLPVLGRPGLEAFFTIETRLRGPSGFAVLSALRAEPEDQLEVLAFLMQRNEPIEWLAEGLRTCTHASDQRVQRRAHMLLARLEPKSEATTNAMLQCLAYDAELRHFAARTLANRADNPRVAAYLHWLQFDDDPFVKRVATDALR